MSRVWRDPGVTVRSSSAGSARPRRIAATRARSSYDELTELPMHTCRVGVPATSVTGTTRPGEDGSAIRGASVARSMVSTSSYTAPSSAARATHSSSRRWAASHRRVCSSLGKMPVVAPVSITMLQIVPRSVAVRDETPSPKNSKMQPRPPRTSRRRNSSSTTSLDCTHGPRRPRNSTATTRGRSTTYGCPAIATATSVAPAPIASIPRAPAMVVWLSAPTSTWPGRAKRSRCR